MELKDLATKIGVVNIIVSHINSDYYKDNITVIINSDCVMNLVGKTCSYIPLTVHGVGKELNMSSVRKILDAIRAELKDKSF